MENNDDILNIEQCDCECHQPEITFKHLALCCIPCLYCQKNIKVDFITQHEKRCENKFFAEDKETPSSEELY